MLRRHNPDKIFSWVVCFHVVPWKLLPSKSMQTSNKKQNRPRWCHGNKQVSTVWSRCTVSSWNLTIGEPWLLALAVFFQPRLHFVAYFIFNRLFYEFLYSPCFFLVPMVKTHWQRKRSGSWDNLMMNVKVINYSCYDERSRDIPAMQWYW